MDKVLIHLLRLWNGRHQLLVAFWYVFIPVFILGRLFKAGFVSNGREDDVAIAAVGLVIISAAKVFSLVSVWRCAPNVKIKDSPLPMLARSVVVISLLPYVLLVLALLTAVFGSL